MPRRSMDRWNHVSYYCVFQIPLLTTVASRTTLIGNTYIKPQPSLMFPQPIKQQVPIHLCFDQHEVDEEDYEIVLDVFVREFLAYGALG